MRCCEESEHGARARALTVILVRAGLRIQEALDLNELDLDRRRGSVLVRRGKGGRRREVGMDEWGFEQLEPWLTVRLRSGERSSAPRPLRGSRALPSRLMPVLRGVDVQNDIVPCAENASASSRASAC